MRIVDCSTQAAWQRYFRDLARPSECKYSRTRLDGQRCRYYVCGPENRSEDCFKRTVLRLPRCFLQAASFEVATIKPAVPDAGGSSGEDGRNGVLRVYNVTLKRCASGMHTQPWRKARFAWRPQMDLTNSRYDILAKADHPAGEPELLTMVQPLLADRFKLEFHRESRMIAGIRSHSGKGRTQGECIRPQPAVRRQRRAWFHRSRCEPDVKTDDQALSPAGASGCPIGPAKKRVVRLPPTMDPGRRADGRRFGQLVRHPFSIHGPAGTTGTEA